MSISTTLKQRLIQKVQALSTVQTVYGHEEINPSGWPAVMVTATSMDGEFASTTEDSRVYAFRIQVLFSTGQDFPQNVNTNRMEYAEQVVAEVVDGIINTMDTDFELTGSVALFMHATDVDWGYVDLESGSARSAELTLSIHTEKTVT